MWTANLVNFPLGIVGPQVDFSDMPDWSVSLNNDTSVGIKVKKNSLPKVSPELWLRPWWGGVLLRWNEVPVVVGPIISRPSESFKDIQLECGSVRSFLQRRMGIVEPADWTTVAKQVTSFSGLSLGTIAMRLVHIAKNKRGGQLPISMPMYEEYTNHQRNYKGFNISNLDVDHLLTNLSGVINGPDIIFKPRMVTDSLFTLDMLVGSENNPRIPQARIPFWDTTSSAGDVVDMAITTTGAYMTNRVYATGAGTDEGTLIAVAENTAQLSAGYPLLETVVSHPSTEYITSVVPQAHSALWKDADTLREITLEVRADGLNRFGSYWPGDLIKINVHNWVTMDAGIHDCRLLTMVGGSTPSNIRLSLQLDTQFDSSDVVDNGE